MIWSVKQVVFTIYFNRSKKAKIVHVLPVTLKLILSHNNISLEYPDLIKYELRIYIREKVFVQCDLVGRYVTSVLTWETII